MVGLSICKMECLIDVDMFLDEYSHWEVEGLYHPLILQEMLLHAAYSGRREVEWMVHWGCWHGLPCPDPKADVSTLQSMRPHTSRQEIRNLYCQVYKPRRLPGSCCVEQNWWVSWWMMWCPLWKTTWGGKRMNCQGNGEGQNLLTPLHAKKNPMGGRCLAATELAEVREAHWRALATTVALKEKIERLSQSITSYQPNICAPSRSWDQWRRRSQGQSRGQCRAFSESIPAHSPAYSPPWWEEKEAEFDLGPPLELGPDVEQFFQGLAGKCKEDAGSHFPAELPAEEYKKWVESRWWAVDTQRWWQELEMIPDVDDIQKLAQKIRASFQLPQQMSKVHNIQNCYLAPPIPNCLCQKDFLSPPDIRFPCWELWEEQWKKTVAYAQALQCWAKRANLPTLGQPSLLAESMLELHETMEQYVSFSNNIILGSVVLLEGFFRSQTSVSRDAPSASSNFPSKVVTMEETTPIGRPLEESTMPWVLHEKWAKMEAPLNWFASWEKVLHPSQPVATMGQAQLASGESKWRHCHWSSEVRRAWCQRMEQQLKAELAEQDSSSPESLEPVHMVAPPLGFEVTWCLQSPLRCPWSSHSQKQLLNPW